MEKNSPKWQALEKIGPGMITGAADDDPSGIATYAQAGALFGMQMLWTVCLTYPLMVAIQLISARIGIVSGRGLSANVRRHYPRPILRGVVALLLIANTINIAADISAMGDAAKLMFHGNAQVYALCFGLLSLVLQIFIPYHKYVYFLKWLTLTLLAYVATAFVIHIPWTEVVWATFFPKISLTKSYVTTVVAVFGTTISPYLFFWQASQEVEEEKMSSSKHALRRSDLETAQKALSEIRTDTVVGMAFSNIVAFFIILTTAVALYGHGKVIQTSAEAALALRPLAGEFAFVLFGLGIIGTGLLAVPVLAGSSAYAVAEMFKWKNSLELAPRRAKGFYGIIAISTVIGIALGYSTLDPFQALYWSAVLNGVIAIPIMIMMMMIAARTDIMGRFIIGRPLKIAGWGAVLVMAITVAAMIITF